MNAEQAKVRSTFLSIIISVSGAVGSAYFLEGWWKLAGILISIAGMEVGFAIGDALQEELKSGEGET